jgi:hypothetical protein
VLWDATEEGKEGEGGAAGEESEGRASARVPGGLAGGSARRSGDRALEEIPSSSHTSCGASGGGLLEAVRKELARSPHPSRRSQRGASRLEDLDGVARRKRKQEI